MKIQQIVETTTAGSVATVAQPLMTQTRENTNVRGLKPVQQVMKGAKKKGPYANSIVESKVTEDDLAEQDLIVIPGQGRLRRTGFVKHDLDQGEHEGHTLKNSLHTIARAASELDKRLSVQSEFPEWVSEKIGAAKSMMVTVMDYLISSQEMQHDSDAINEGEVSTSNLRTMYDLARMAKNYCNPEGQESLNELLKILKWYMDQAEQGVAEGAIKDVESKIRTHDQRKADREQAGDPYVAHELHSHNVIRKQLLDKRKRAQAEYHKKMDQQGVAESIDAAWAAAKEKVEEGWKSNLAGAALAGAAALGGGAHAHEIQPIVAQITFQVDGKSITKDINLGTDYNSPGQASEAVKDFMKSKGIKFYNFKLYRADVQPPLVSKDEMDASNQEYQRQQDSNNLSNTPYSATGAQTARLQDRGYTSSSRPGASIAYEGKKVDRFVKHVEKSEEKTGKSKKDAENIAWATANKRGMLDNKNKKK